MNKWLIEYDCQYEDYGFITPRTMLVEADDRYQAIKAWEKIINQMPIAWAFKPRPHKIEK